jgi:hypothetical protein
METTTLGQVGPQRLAAQLCGLTRGQIPTQRTSQGPHIERHAIMVPAEADVLFTGPI